MKTADELVKDYLAENFTMQLATVSNGSPWVCTVRFLADAQNNIYWASLPSRRHSQEIKNDSKVACAIVVQNVIGTPVIGIQIEGDAEMIEPPVNDTDIVKRYAEKFVRDSDWVDDFIKGNTDHRLYKLTPSSIYLFDEENFPGGQRQQVL